jgi:serine/threonine protein kinase
MGLHYLHSNGNAHRDLKPENIMLDKDYSVKIIDFGFTCNIAGRNGTGTNSSGVGTPGYMAPEILLKQPYQANAVDLFALGVILFIIYAGHPPFNLAKDDDSHYRLLASQRADLFWKAHSNSKAKDFFTEEFKDLITAMLQLQPHMRLCMSDIIGHPWMQQEYPTADEIAEEFGRRHAINKQKAGAEESRKASMAENVNDRRARRGAAGNNQAIYCDADDVPADLKENTNLKTLALGKYTESDAKHINFFSMFDATELMTQITNYLAT